MITLNISKLPHLSHGFYAISEPQARKLCGGSLPEFGRERLVEYRGDHFWVSRTPTNNAKGWVWSIRKTDLWVLIGGRAQTRTIPR